MTETRWIEGHVTAEDISEGKARDCGECPAARSLSRACGQPMRTGGTFVWPENEPTLTTSVRVPRSLSRFIAAFDHGATATGPDSLAPFSYKIELPAEWVLH